MAFSSMADVKDFLQKAITLAMSNEVVEMAKYAEQSAIDKVVYGAGQPTYYARRKESGGLSSHDNMIPSIGCGGNKVTMTLTNVTPYNAYFMPSKTMKFGSYSIADEPQPVSTSFRGSSTLAQTIEYGLEENYDAGRGWWSMPRPFTKTAMEYLDHDKTHIQALQIGLEGWGIKAV